MANIWTNLTRSLALENLHLPDPWWLLLLIVLVPALYWIGRDSLTGMGRTRARFSLFLRIVLVFLLLLSLADLQWVHSNNSISTIFVLDRSLSIPMTRTESALAFIDQAARLGRQAEDTFGVVVFGGDARVEVAPSRTANGVTLRLASDPANRQQSDLSAGLRLARGLVPPGSTPRIVVLSDGNENRGDALAEAVAASETAVPIDVVPLDYTHTDDVLVDKISTPAELQEGEPIPLRVVLHSRRPTKGRLQLFQVGGTGRRSIAEHTVELRSGSTAITTTVPPTVPGSYTFEAEFIPEDLSVDAVTQNNRASAFVRVQGQARVLAVTPTNGSHKDLVDLLEKEKFLVTTQSPEQLPGDAVSYQGFDAILLANVPADRIDEAKQRFLAAATRDQGIGLVMIGGPQSFGAGNYFETPIEQVLPVLCTVQATVVQPSLDLVLIIDVSGSMLTADGNVIPLDMAKRGAINTIEMLDNRARAGIISFSGESDWVAPLQTAANRNSLIRKIRTMPVGGGTVMYPALRMAFEALLSSKAMVRHVIVLSDGQSSPADFEGLARMYAEAKISLSTVAIGTGADLPIMKRIALLGKGQFYHAAHPATVPGIYLRELHRVYRPLIYENPVPWSPIVLRSTMSVSGLASSLPPIRGMVLTTAKPTAEVPVISPQPPELEQSPILAHWQVGLGKSAAVTTDAGERWATAWKGTPAYQTFWTDVVRWVQRSAETGELTLMTQEENGRIAVVVEGMDKDQEYLNFLRLQGSAVLPDGTTQKIELTQTEPGKYVADFPVTTPGSYAITVGGVLPNGQTALASTGHSVSYSREFRDTESNRGLLENIASISGGEVIEPQDVGKVDFFRRDRPMNATLFAIWPELLVAALLLFLMDVAVRRIRIEPSDLAPVVMWIRKRFSRHEPAAVSSPVIQRLQSRKREVSETFGEPKERESKANPTFVAKPSAIATHSTTAMPTPAEDNAPSTTEEPTANEYTSRLLAAKRNVKHDRK